jgi:hypothetical protein
VGKLDFVEWFDTNKTIMGEINVLELGTIQGIQRLNAREIIVFKIET